jgi:hypothetical protein
VISVFVKSSPTNSNVQQGQVIGSLDRRLANGPRTSGSPVPDDAVSVLQRTAIRKIVALAGAARLPDRRQRLPRCPLSLRHRAGGTLVATEFGVADRNAAVAAGHSFPR